jgi:hypothetical protein
MEPVRFPASHPAESYISGMGLLKDLGAGTNSSRAAEPKDNWCRYRRAGDHHCMYPDNVNERATALAGYVVWVPLDRGYCARDWNAQSQCGIGEPGANTAGAHLDVTIPWEDGGQRVGVPVPDYGDPAYYSGTPARVE